MVGVGVGKNFKTDQTHELVDLAAFFAQYPPGNKASLDVSADSEPRKEIRILKNETTFRAWLADWLGTNQEFPGIGRIEAGNEPEKRRLTTPTWADEGNKFSRGE
jgi:hypothetical protein